MPRRSRKKSGFEALYDQLKWYLIGGVTLFVAILIFAFEYPILSIVLVIFFVVGVIWFLRRRRRIEKNFRRMELKRAQYLGELLVMTGKEFEIIVGDLFIELGFTNVERIGGSGDLGVDLHAISPDGLQVIVQCKRYGMGQKVGSPAVQSLMGAVVNRGADIGIFVTTSSFTTPAMQYASTGNIRIRLIDGAELTSLAHQVVSDGGDVRRGR